MQSNTDTTSTRQSLYQPRTNTADDGDDCDCPIHTDGAPMSLPLGVPFRDRVTVAPIDADTAGAIYRAHHSYRPSVPGCTNICHHGIYHDGELMGALTWNQPLYNGPKFGIRPDGQLTRDYDEAVDTVITDAGAFAQAARICIGVDYPNLASCGLARSMERFCRDHVDRLELDWLLTFIRDDHVGSMLKALLDKGWQWVGLTRPQSPPGNRETDDIHQYRKQRWVYPVADYRQLFDVDCDDVPAPRCFNRDER